MTDLNPSRRGFNWPNARASLEHCINSYQPAKSVIGTVFESAATDARGVINYQSDCIILAFRGSQSLRDWVQDFKTAKKHPRRFLVKSRAGMSAEVHQGFLEDVESISPDIQHLLRGQTRPIFVTGHSKGGGEAVLCAEFLQRLGHDIAGVYTFGQPRVGNAAFTTVYNGNLYEETFCVVNQNDIVPRTPPLYMGYRRLGQKVFLSATGGWIVNPPLWLTGISDMIGILRGICRRTEVLAGDHHWQSYRNRIAGLK